MRQILLMIGLALVLLLGIGALLLGAFPPTPTATPVQHVLPNDRFPSQ